MRHPGPARSIVGVLLTLAWLPLGAQTTQVGPETLLEGPALPDEEPPTLEEIDLALTRGIDFLVQTQQPDGSWGSPRRTKNLNIFAPVPGAHHAFGTATTSLALMGLLEAEDHRPSTQEAIVRGEAWLLTTLPRLRRATPVAIYNIWAHAYAIRALVRLHHRAAGDAPRQERIKELLRQQVDLLDRYEVVDGGWSYYDFAYRTQQPGGSSSSFTTATALIALHEATQLGVEVPQKMVDRAVASIQRQRNPDFSYWYGEYFRWRPLHGINRPGGSLARSQSCNLALRRWGDEAITEEVMEVWLDRLFARNGWLSIGRKRPVPHESWFSVSGYFYYYGHHYAALCLEELSPPVQRRCAAHLARILLERQETDGSWWDYPLYDYHQQYGTGYVLPALVRCRWALESR